MTNKLYRVLVVDDSAANRMVASGHLRSAGYDIQEAATGEEALEVLARDRFDLVLLDVLMPGLGGFETCRRLRSDPRYAATPVLFLSALDQEETSEPAREAGGNEVLTKPLKRAALLARIEALLDRKGS